ncbi:nitrilase-related carbon-nitrogen hydrolase [Oscillospiraceae bacterium LTW-04]|nr:nitrilase-related carbon-nitrogen hydrolase [Oscillospiraceae bacterium MB24-C1]
MYKLRLKASAFAMSYLSNEEKVRAQVRNLHPHTDKPAPFLGAGGVKVSAVCFKPKVYKSIRDYITHMNNYVAAAAASGSQLIAFPELCGMAAMSIMPGFSTLNADLKKLNEADIEEQKEALFAVCETVQGFVGEIFHNTFSQLAQSHRIIIAAGGLFQLEDKQLYNRQFLFSETGEVVGIQDKLFLSSWEKRVGVTAGTRITPGDTHIGRIAMLDGLALKHYEPFWIAASSGCSFAVAGASPFFVTDYALARFRAQEQGLCVLSPGICGGQECGPSFSSPAGIYAPRAATRSRDGIAAEGGDQTVITARVDLSRASSQFDLYSDDKNPRFFQRLLL